MQTLRKKTSPFKYKHETSRFHGEGQCFKAKLIGILEVSEARGDRMCQEALSDLKMAIRAAGEHKQRITVHIALDGLRLRDEKTGDCLYHHPVHKISFIAQDMTDSRAFGYIFGSPDTGHRFFGIKTDKAASQVVIAMRDLFQVVFALKKKEIELAKQHLEKNCLYNSSLFSDSSSNKSVTPELPAKYEAIKGENNNNKSTSSEKSGTTVANLVDLQLELNSLQQGLNQMEKITPSEPLFGSKDDPFGDSFTSFPVNPILPPPPSSGRERSRGASESSSSVFSPKTPHTGDSSTTTNESYPFTNLPKTEFKLSRSDFSSSHDEPSSGEWFTPSNSLFDETSSETSQKTAKNDQLEQKKREILSQFDVFTELDPLGTGRSKPYIDRKHFFQELKNPPKKPLKELATNVVKNCCEDDSDPFGEDPFVSLDPFDDSEQTDLFEREFAPEPPPRPDIPVNITNFLIKPPPLPPKKLDATFKPPPRPPHSETEQLEPVGVIEKIDKKEEEEEIQRPPLPIPMRKITVLPSTFEDDYLRPVSVPPEPKNDNLDGLDITLSQLTLSGLNELAVKLNIPTAQLSNMTLVQLTDYLSNVIKTNQRKPEVETSNTFKADFESNFTQNTSETYDRYAVFRELIDEEISCVKPTETVEAPSVPAAPTETLNADDDKYAALREIDLPQIEASKAEIEPRNGDVVVEPEVGGSLSDLVSNSSPELTEEKLEEEKSWAVFDQVVEKPAVQSEEGLSPWSSDSKDGNGTPSDYRESGGDRWVTSRKNPPVKHHHRHEEDWWDTSAEPEGNYNNSANNRRSTDSFEDEYYECYDRPRRRKQVVSQQNQVQQSQGGGNWGGGGGHSSSSRDVSPWEEEPKNRRNWARSRHRRATDSWDEDDDYDYEDSRRFHWSGSRESDRHSVVSTRDNDNERCWNEEWDERRRRRRTGATNTTPRDNSEHWCCPDWHEEYDNVRYGSGRWSSAGTPPTGNVGNSAKWRERKQQQQHEDRYFSREESSWDDEYNTGRAPPANSTSVTKRANWKRPNSASEMERKSEKLRHLGGSDGERERRYKGNRRSRSRDSQYSEPASYRHKDTNNCGGSLNRSYKKNYNVKAANSAASFEAEQQQQQHHLEHSEKKLSQFSTLQTRSSKLKKDENNTNTFPRKTKLKQQNFQDGRNVVKTCDQSYAHSMFEDDFSLDKLEIVATSSVHNIHTPTQEISVIKEEETTEENDSFEPQQTNNSRTINNKRFSGCLRSSDLKKSDSVNIFVREKDPFDDVFFRETIQQDERLRGFVVRSNNSDRKLRNGDKWTDD